MNLATTTPNALESLVAILVLALVHLFVRELRRVEAPARNALLSAGAGASLAYVMMRIMPKLAEKQDDLLASRESGVLGFLEHNAYLMALIGLVLYYGLSGVAKYGTGGDDPGSAAQHRAALIATSVGYAAYSFLIGYLMVNRLHLGLFSMVLITLGMGTLFMVSDHGLHKKWPHAYDRWMRWVLSAALLSGWAVGVWVEVSPNVVALWYAFLAGLMLITTVGERLYGEASGSFWPFLAGVVIFTAFLLILEQMLQTAV